MEGCREIDANDGVPFVDREFLDGSDMLDACIVDEKIERTI